MILHRDPRCVVVDKPSGIATHRGWDDSDDALLQVVRDTVNAYVYPIHRLDRGASGIVLFALDKEAARAFSDAWPLADKRYLAITRGHPAEHVVLDHAIPKAPGEERVPASPRSGDAKRLAATRSSRRGRGRAGSIRSAAT